MTVKVQQIPVGSLDALQEGYRSGKWSPTDVLSEVQSRIEQAGDDHVWITRLPATEITRQLDDLAGRKRSGAPLPLFGIPFAVKDNYDRPAREVIAGLQMEILKWTDNAGSHDDVTFFVIRAVK